MMERWSTVVLLRAHDNGLSVARDGYPMAITQPVGPGTIIGNQDRLFIIRPSVGCLAGEHVDSAAITRHSIGAGGPNRDRITVHTVASHGDLTNYHFCLEKKETFGEEEIRPPRLLTGDDLIDFGYVPGPIFAEILERVEDAQLEGELATREEAIDLLRREFPRKRDTRPLNKPNA